MMKITTDITKRQCIAFTGALLTLMTVFLTDAIIGDAKSLPDEPIIATKYQAPTEAETIEIIDTSTEQLQAKENPIYEGFKYYEIPEEYIKEGGSFPKKVQKYLWKQCKKRKVDYYIVVALIERESGYKADATGDNGNSKGYMQIWESWHTERMAEENVTDLYNPYENIRVGLNLLQELTGGDTDLDDMEYHYMLMCYNAGTSRAKEYITQGIYSSEYSRAILKRAGEIKQELKD
jgi:soluble lytic murein transglycosylase-like protein